MMLNFQKNKLLCFFSIFLFLLNVPLNFAFDINITEKLIDKPFIYKENLFAITENGRIIVKNVNDEAPFTTLIIGEKIKEKPGLFGKYLTLIGDLNLHIFNLDSLKKEFTIAKNSLTLSNISHSISNGTHILVLTDTNLSLYPLTQKTSALWNINLMQNLQTKSEATISKEIIIYGNFQFAGISIDETYFVYDIRNRGNLRFSYNVGKLFKSKPILLTDYDIIYGNTRGEVAKLGLGVTYWKYYPYGSVNSRLLILDSQSGSYIVFTASDGSVYALNSAGKLAWKKTVGPINDIDVQDAIIAVGHGNNIMLLDFQGDIIGELNLRNEVLYVLVKQNKVIAITKSSNNIYRIKLYYLTPTCFIDIPKHRDQLKPGDILIIGKYYSTQKDPQISVMLDNKEYNAVPLSKLSTESNLTLFLEQYQENLWIAEIEQTTLGNLGSKSIRCKIRNNDGKEFVSEALTVFVTNKGLERNIIVDAPLSVLENSNFTLKLFDETGFPLKRVTIEFDGNVYEVNETIDLFSGSAGKKALTIKKDGYREVVKAIDVISFQPLIVLLFVFVLFVIGIFLILRG